MKNLHLIYIPGLGDSRFLVGQRTLVSTWRFWGVQTEFFQMHWADGEAWESKLGRLLERIDTLGANNSIGLVGCSAGAAAVVNAYARRSNQIVGCVLIAAKVNHPESIGEDYRRENPAFVMAAQSCQEALTRISQNDRGRILSRYARADGVVSTSDSQVEGAHNQLLPSVNHALLIGIQIAFGAPSFIRFLKHLPKRGSSN